MPEIARPDARIHYRFRPGSDAPALVFLNSLGTDLSMWEGVIAALPPGPAILGIDARGHGGSRCESAEASVDLLAGDVLAVLEAAGISRAVLIGLSLGGLVAQKIAIAHPDLVAGLVLCATSAAFRPPQMWAERKAKTLAEGSAAFTEPSRARWFTEGFLAEHPATAARLLAMVGASADLGYAACCGVLETTDLTEDLHRIMAPTLLIAGAEDLATPVAGHAAIAVRIQGARLEVISPAAHMLAVERPEETAGLIADFLRRL